MTVVVRWAVASATTFVVASARPEDELYTAVQLALRGAVVTRAHSAVDPERAAVAAEVLAAVAARAGIDVFVRVGERIPIDRIPIDGWR